MNSLVHIYFDTATSKSAFGLTECLVDGTVSCNYKGSWNSHTIKDFYVDSKGEI